MFCITVYSTVQTVSFIIIRNILRSVNLFCICFYEVAFQKFFFCCFDNKKQTELKPSKKVQKNNKKVVEENNEDVEEKQEEKGFNQGSTILDLLISSAVNSGRMFN